MQRSTLLVLLYSALLGAALLVLAGAGKAALRPGAQDAVDAYVGYHVTITCDHGPGLAGEAWPARDPDTNALLRSGWISVQPSVCAWANRINSPWYRHHRLRGRWRANRAPAATALRELAHEATHHRGWALGQFWTEGQVECATMSALGRLARALGAGPSLRRAFVTRARVDHVAIVAAYPNYGGACA